MRRVINPMSTHVRSAAPTDLAGAADTLAAAFADYPWTRYVIPDDGYAERLRRIQFLYLRHSLQHGIVGVTDPAGGVIALLPPDAPEPDPATVQEIIALHGDRADRLAPGDSAPTAAESETSAPAPWRLETLGVRPDRQGAGLGSALVRFGLEAAARHAAHAIALDTSDPRNVRLYERFGFATVAHSEVPGGPPVWVMRCDAAPLRPSATSRRG